MFISLKILWYNRNVVLNNINYICRSFKIKQLVLTNQLHYAKENAIFLVVAMLMLMLIATVNAQVTTSSIAGKVTAQKEPIIGATVVAIHEASGTRYGAITNVDGRFTMQGMRL